MTDHHCHQRVPLPDGTTTPGFWHQPHLERVLSSLDFTGRRVLDVGTLEGRWAFHAEQHGAREVVAIDVFPPGVGRFQPGFWWLHERFKSRVAYHELSIYDAHPDYLGQFDLVLFTGVYYHLLHPTLGFERVNELLAPGGVAVIEGCVSLEPGCSARFFLPPDNILYGDPTNHWLPTRECLESWMTAAGLVWELSEVSGPDQYSIREGPVEVERVVYVGRQATPASAA